MSQSALDFRLFNALVSVFHIGGLIPSVQLIFCSPALPMRAYLQLLRLPTVFTAIADVLMGGAVAFASSPQALPLQDWLRTAAVWLLILLVAASCCLYLAGMVLNDFFDRHQDAAERPQRPIPSGRVSASAAAWLGGELLLAGVALTLAASWWHGGWRPAQIGLAIAVCVVAYDAWLKKTILGPLAMGACRALNVLLGMSIAAATWQAPHFLIAGGLGLFVAGITAVGRTEARQSHRGWVFTGLALMWLGMALVASFPYADGLNHQLEDTIKVWPWIWIVLGLQTGWRLMHALVDPTPGHVQAAVRYGILSLVVFDAIITFAVVGMVPALCVLTLLVPTLVLSRWLYVT